MDSKYASMGKQNGAKKNTFKRKGFIQNINVKKHKASNVDKPFNSNGVTTPSGVEKSPLKQETRENLQETRKQLPVYTVRNRLLEEIKKNSTMILIGETGSGKTTQIPQLIHEQRLEGAGAIAVTQPRRVAAITIATRVAAEMTTEIGNIVGYSVRFEDMTSPRTKLKYVTDGMLLREAIVDPLLKRYSIVILDEAHERTVSTDVLFGIVKLAQKERIERKLNPLKVIVMSATMDVDAFRRYFDNCPVIYLEGRAHPVTIYHSKQKQEDYQYAAVCTLFELHRTMPPNNDILVFLTGQEEIETVMYNIMQIAKEAPGPPLLVCPLYAGLPAARQLRVWRATPPGARKVVLATNVAEASVTIPRVACVIDSGLVKERTWCTATGAERLRVRACAQAAAWQRAGRAGRTAAGAAYRLYTAAEFAARPQHCTPEIVRSVTRAMTTAPVREAAAWQRAGRAGRTAAGAAYRLYTAAEFAARPQHCTPEIVRSVTRAMTTAPVREAAAWQRAGRAGRTAAGAAYRLYTAAEFAARPQHCTPEIVRSVTRAMTTAPVREAAAWQRAGRAGRTAAGAAYRLYTAAEFAARPQHCTPEIVRSVTRAMTTAPVREAAAWQRAGRAGRTAAGAAYRLYTAAEFAARPQHCTPEIVRSVTRAMTTAPVREAAAWQRAGRAGRTAAGAAYRLYTAAEFAARPQHCTPEIVRSVTRAMTTAPVREAAAWQRAGRAGRTAAGAAYRLYTAAELAARPQHCTPEIVRCPLAPTILLLIAAGLEPNNFPLIDPPPIDSINASLTLLKELGAIESENNPKLTVLGKKMASFPIDPKYSKVLLSAPEFNCLDEALSLVAMLSSENIFHTPMHKREEALKVKQKFISPLGDHMTLLNVYKAFCKAPLKKQWCKENYLNHKNLVYASDVRQQLLSICQRLNMEVNSCGTNTDQVLKSLVCGLFTNCAYQRGAGARYVTGAGAAATLHPGGALHAARPPPPAVLYSELLLARRAYLVTVSALQPHWLAQLAPDHARRCRANR